MQIKNLAGQVIEELSAEDFFDLQIEEEAENEIIPFEMDDSLSRQPVSAEDVEKAEQMLREMMKKSADELNNNNNNNHSEPNNNNSPNLHLPEEESVIVYDEGMNYSVPSNAIKCTDLPPYTISDDKIQYTSVQPSTSAYVTLDEDGNYYTNSFQSNKNYAEGINMINNFVTLQNQMEETKLEEKDIQYVQSEVAAPYCYAYWSAWILDITFPHCQVGLMCNYRNKCT